MNVKEIFIGVTPRTLRDYIGQQIIATERPHVYMPCIGRFGVALAYMHHGGTAANVMGSDIGIFSSVIGCLSDTTKDIDALGLTFAPEIPPPKPDDPYDIGAVAMLSLKLGQLKATNRYMDSIRRELWVSWDEYKATTRKMLEGITTALAGIRYDIRDMWEVIREAAADPDGVLFVNAPTYKGGYDKMFREEFVSWRGIDAVQFEPGERNRLFREFEQAKCAVFVGLKGSLEGVPSNYRPVLAQPYKIDRTDYIVTNLPDTPAFAIQRLKDSHEGKWPIYTDQEITPASVVSCIPVKADVATYYRNLMTHRLGSTGTWSTYAFLVDGRVFAVTSIKEDGICRGVVANGEVTDYVYEHFGIVKTSRRWPKGLKKLYLWCLTSGTMRDLIVSRLANNINIRGLRAIHTTSFTKGMTEAVRRGISELVSRELQPNGLYRLQYRSMFREDTMADCLTRWLAANSEAEKADGTQNAAPEPPKQRGGNVARRRDRNSTARPE